MEIYSNGISAKVSGPPGKDGFSPTVDVSEIEGGHQVTITDAEGPKSFDVMDGSGSEGVAFTTDDTLTMDKNNVLGVTVPVKGATKEEFNSMSDEQKQGLVIVTDENLVGSQSQEIYSTEETRIGTWIDGKPVYRKVLKFNSPTTLNNWVNIGEQIYNVAQIIRLDSVLYQAGNPQYYNLPVFSTAGGSIVAGIRFYKNNSSLSMYVFNSAFANCPVISILKYTKTTDEATISISAEQQKVSNSDFISTMPVTATPTTTEII